MRLYEHGRNIRNEMLAAAQAITAWARAAGRVGISVPSGYGQIVMSDWLIEFKRLYPASCSTCCSRTGPTICATMWTSPSA
jgi:DNA-binding transcriptional LysR family regulator